VIARTFFLFYFVIMPTSKPNRSHKESAMTDFFSTLRRSISLPVIVIISFFFFQTNCFAEIYFEEDFETGTVSTSPNPVWHWKDPITPGNPSAPMYYGGENDIYTVSSKKVHNGKYALAMDYNGRNGFCNACGTIEVVVDETSALSQCINITGSPWGSSIYNKTNGFSQWAVTSSSENEVCFDASTAIGPSMTSPNSISVGDVLKLPYQCDVNGTIAKRINRRSDCNKAINYLDGIEAEHLGYGKSISRRFYVYIPSNAILPSITLKLGYAHFRKSGKRVSNTLKVSVQRNMQFELGTPGGIVVPDYYVDKDKWYYMEEVWTRETSEIATDGSYKLYAGPEGTDVFTPIVTQTNVLVGELIDMSINGNWQHTNDVSGFTYFDDILISDGYAGPIGGRNPPNPPPSLAVESN
jgi:hypothetical protein